MTASSKRGPTLCRHKRTGHAYAKFDGRQLWFGRYDDPSTHERFARALASWRANGCRLPASQAGTPRTVADLVASYLAFAEGYYCQPDGSPSREIDNVRDAVRPLLSVFATQPTEEFGLRELKVLREQLIARGLARTTINDRVGRIQRLLGWAVEEELCRPELAAALRALKPLRRGRTRAKESKRIPPVSREAVEAVLPHVTRPVAGLLELMWHTGMRPGEACRLRPGDIDQSGPVWFYRPSSHKTQNYGRDRVIAIGPQGQAILLPFLTRVPLPPADAPLFSPSEAMKELRHKRRQQRRTPLWDSHQRAQAAKRRDKPRKHPGNTYTPGSLLGAVRRACKASGTPLWTTNQIRHAAASRIRKELGLEAARAVLGHSSAQVTEIYAEIDRGLAEQAMRQLG